MRCKGIAPCFALPNTAGNGGGAQNSRRNRYENEIFTPHLGKKGLVTI